MNNDKMEFTQKVKFVNLVMLDFTNDSGDSIHGLKLYYLVNPDEHNKNLYVGGRLENSFLNLVDYKEKFDLLKRHYNECLSKKIDCYVTLVFSLENFTKKPKIVDVKI